MGQNSLLQSKEELCSLKVTCRSLIKLRSKLNLKPEVRRCVRVCVCVLLHLHGKFCYTSGLPMFPCNELPAEGLDVLCE